MKRSGPMLHSSLSVKCSSYHFRYDSLYVASISTGGRLLKVSLAASYSNAASSACFALMLKTVNTFIVCSFLKARSLPQSDRPIAYMLAHSRRSHCAHNRAQLSDMLRTAPVSSFWHHVGWCHQPNAA